jgi:hypothetical protein
MRIEVSPETERLRHELADRLDAHPVTDWSPGFIKGHDGTARSVHRRPTTRAARGGAATRQACRWNQTAAVAV